MDLSKVDMKAIKSKASQAVNKAKEATQTAVSSGMAYHQAHPEAAAKAMSGAKSFVAACAVKAWIPTKELQDFFKAPSIDGLAENPLLIFQCLQALTKMNHPKASLMATMMKVCGLLYLSHPMNKVAFVLRPDKLNLSNSRNQKTQEGMAKAQGSSGIAQAQQQMQQQVMTQAANAAVNSASGGMVTELPPEVSQQAVQFLKQNPQEFMQLMKYASEAASSAR